MEIFGDGETSRDFCYVANVVEANLRAAVTPVTKQPPHLVLNVACGDQTSLNQLFQLIIENLSACACLNESIKAPLYRPERAGDVRHSLADISALRAWCGWAPTIKISQGLAETVRWYLASRPK